MERSACTIVARNYLPAARVLASSFRKLHPDVRFVVLVLEERARLGDLHDEQFDLLAIDEIGIDSSELHRMAMIYEILELATALKPWLLATLLVTSDGGVLYLDPDIVVFDVIDDLFELASRFDAAVTPHVLDPLPNDGRRVNDDDLLGSGMFNLGFIGANRRARDLLVYWQDRLRRDCFVDPAAMRFVDQRWIDLAIGMFEFGIDRSPGSNVAYWNLGTRVLTERNGRRFVDGQALRFFHFSGYHPNEPWLLSRHQGERPRVLLSEHPELQRLCDDYADALRNAGYDDAQDSGYQFDVLPDATPVDRAMRLAYREALSDAEQMNGKLPPDGFDPAEIGAFARFLDEPFSPKNPLSRYLDALWRTRPDLRVAFPEPGLADRETFAEWLNHEVVFGRLDERFSMSRGKRATGP